jgi:hypothetical protein
MPERGKIAERLDLSIPLPSKQGFYRSNIEGILFEKGGETMKKTRIAEAVVGVAAVMTLTVMVGRIVPVNLLADNTGFSTVAAAEECCGPYAQPCPEFKYPAN